MEKSKKKKHQAKLQKHLDLVSKIREKIALPSKLIQKSFDKIREPMRMSATPFSIPLMKSPYVTQEENAWERHGEYMALLNKMQDGMDKTTKLTQLVIFLTVLSFAMMSIQTGIAIIGMGASNTQLGLLSTFVAIIFVLFIGFIYVYRSFFINIIKKSDLIFLLLTIMGIAIFFSVLYILLN